ncbi:GNAT family N-acetyltransferase [Pseudonocardiaceae bacterium YIM PH 21723]|nr:GNAT family N-acetyltransferase [Pseudonocardiaceae bacterium YIM PH 21723]
MTIVVHEELTDFWQLAGPYYLTDPTRYSTELVVADRFLNDPAADRSSLLLITVQDEQGQALGAALQTPGRGMLAGGIPASHSAELVAGLIARGIELTGCYGPQPESDALAKAWTDRTGAAIGWSMTQRAFALSILQPPKLVPGYPVRAELSKLDLLSRWLYEFAVEAKGEYSSPEPPEDMMRRRIEQGGILLWYVSGEPVAFAGRSPVVNGISRIAPVYTPESHRGRGYGAAVTAAVSQEALDAGSAAVLLNTDLDNPVSNRIYQRLGYRPIFDAVDHLFTRPTRSQVPD